MKKYLPILLLAGSTAVFAIDERIEALKQAILGTMSPGLIRDSMAQVVSADALARQVSAIDRAVYEWYEGENNRILDAVIILRDGRSGVRPDVFESKLLPMPCIGYKSLLVKLVKSNSEHTKLLSPIIVHNLAHLIWFKDHSQEEEFSKVILVNEKVPGYSENFKKLVIPKQKEAGTA